MEIIGFTKKEIDSLLVFNKGGYEGKILLYNNELVLKQFEKYLCDLIDFERKKYKLERIASRKLSHVIVSPTAFVSVEGEFSGYLMPKISNAMHIDSIRDYQKLLIVYSKLFKDLDYLHKKNVVVGDLKPANILVDYKYNTKFCDVDSMGIDEFPIDHSEYRSHEAKLLPNYNKKFEVNSRENMDNYLLLACFINSLSNDNSPLVGKLFNSKLSLEYKKILLQLLKGDVWSTPVDISTMLEEEKRNVK